MEKFKRIFFILLLIVIALLMTQGGWAKQEWKLIDPLEAHHNWFCVWQNYGIVSYVTDLPGSGDTTIKLKCENPNPSDFTDLVFSINDRSDSKYVEKVRLELTLDSENASESVSLRILRKDSTPTYDIRGAFIWGQTITKSYGKYSVEITNVNATMDRLVFDIDDFTKWRHDNSESDHDYWIYIDNIQFDFGDGYVTWDDCAEPPSSYDWVNHGDAYLSEKYYSYSLYSSNNNSASSVILDWEGGSYEDEYGPCDPTVDHANTYVTNLYSENYDWREYWYIKFDVYRPGNTNECTETAFRIKDNNGYIISTSPTKEGNKITNANQWTTMILPLWSDDFDLEGNGVNTLEFYVYDTYENPEGIGDGTLYFDNLYVGGYVADATEDDPVTVSDYPNRYEHILQDYENGSSEELDRNKFDGVAAVGAHGDNDPGCTLEVVSDCPNITGNDYALKIRYDLDNSVDNFAFYSNHLYKRAETDKFVFWMKGATGTDNPERVKIEFKNSDDINMANIWLSGITTEWQQWVVDLSDLPYKTDSFDKDDIYIVNLVLDYWKAGGDRDVYLYIDELAFYDKDQYLSDMPGLYRPQASDNTKDVYKEGVPYLFDDFDGRVLHYGDPVWDPYYNDGEGKWVYHGDIIDRGHTEFFGYTGDLSGDCEGDNSPDTYCKISSAESGEGGYAHSFPYSLKFDYEFVNGAAHSWFAYYNCASCYNSARDEEGPPRDLSFADKFSIWIKSGGAGNNPGQLQLEFHDERWGQENDQGQKEYQEGKAYVIIKDIPDNEEWVQYWIDLTNDKLVGEVQLDKLKEISISDNYTGVDDKSGCFYIDDMFFVDTDLSFDADSDFDLTDDYGDPDPNSAFLNLVEKRTFQYFVECFDPITGLYWDRSNYSDLATIAGTGFGLTALVIGVENGWIDSTSDDPDVLTAESIIIKTLNTFLNAPMPDTLQDIVDNTNDYVGYKGLFFHFLDTVTNKRKGGDGVSSIDTALLMAGVLTVREYYAEARTGTHNGNTDIRDKADELYSNIDWKWFLDTSGDYSTNDYYNQFHMGWWPENVENSDEYTGFGGHWDCYTDETLLIGLLAIGSGDVSADAFYAFKRYENPDKDIITSWAGSLFNYFFANCWFDLYGDKGNYQGKDPGNMYDEFGVNWWKNSVNAGLANRDYCINGIDGTGRTNVSTYHANSWGLSSCQGVPSGLNNSYLGENGTQPNVRYTLYENFGANDPWSNHEADGTVPPYGGISMIGFSRHTGGIPAIHIRDLMKHFYKNTQLWTGWYGFRDAYTDDDQVKDGADSLYPIYDAGYYSIDQGPMLIMLENYKTGLIWDIFMKNSGIQNAMEKVFTGNLKLNNVHVVSTISDDNKWFIDYLIAKDKDFTCKGNIEAKNFTIENGRDVTLTVDDDVDGDGSFTFNEDVRVELGGTLKGIFGD